MNKEQALILNDFFVNVFNQILAWEDQTLKKTGKKDLSVRELHVIEAVDTLKSEKQNTMANIAKLLAVSPGSLTTSVNVLVKKGYLTRSYSEKDRRVVYVDLTDMGKEVKLIHTKFHEEMIMSVDDALKSDEFDILISALTKLKDFFASKI